MDNRLEDKIDRMSDKITSIDVTLAKQSVILEEHVKRSNLLEEKMEPLEKHVHMVNGVSKFLVLVGVLVAVIEGIIKIFGG